MIDERTKQSQEQLFGLVAQKYGCDNVEHLLRFLYDYDLLNFRHCRAVQTCMMVEKLVAEGKYVSEALHMVADRLACSYECVRKNYYSYCALWNKMKAELQICTPPFAFNQLKQNT